jgi:hypothetical protein
MRYYVAKGPIKEAGYTWDLSLYKVNDQMYTEVIRFYPDDTIIKDIVKSLNFFFIQKHCKKITKEEYESILGL